MTNANTKKRTPRHIIVKLVKFKHKERNLEISQRKATRYLWGKMTGSGMTHLKYWKKMSSKNDGEIKENMK